MLRIVLNNKAPDGYFQNRKSANYLPLPVASSVQVSEHGANKMSISRKVITGPLQFSRMYGSFRELKNAKNSKIEADRFLGISFFDF